MKPDLRAEQPAANSIKTASRLCRRVQNRLMAYSDGDLNAKSRQGVARHLEECAACRQELRLLTQTEQILTASASGIAAPGDLRAGFYVRLDAAPRPRSTWRAAAPAFALCGLALFVSGTVYRLRGLSYESAVVAKGPGVNDGRSLAVAPPSTVSRSIAGLPDDARAKPLPTVTLWRDRQIANNRAVSPAVSITPRRLHTAQPARPLMAALTVKRPAVTTETVRDRHHSHSRAFIATGRQSTALQHSRLAAAAKSPLPGQRGAQIAMLTRGEHDDVGLAERARFGFGRTQQAAPGGRQGVRSEATDNSAANSGKQDGIASEQASIRVTFSNNNFAAASPYFRYEGSREEETEGVHFEVKDAQRGFKAGTRSESRMQLQNGRQVLSVHLEDQDAPTPGAADKDQSEPAKTKPESDTKTGSEK